MRRLLALGLICWASLALAQPFPAKIVQTSQVSCGSTATQIDALRNRNAITVKVPLNGATTYVGPAGVTTTTGFGIDAGNALTLQPFSGALFCVTATTQTVNVVQSLP